MTHAAASRHEHLVHHLEHVLPGQAPIRDFVHHNTLHGFQHLPFPEALAEARKVTGIYGYLPAAEFRALFRAGRITSDDLDAVLAEAPGLAAAEQLAPGLTRGDVCRAALLADLSPLDESRLAWQVDEMGALTRLQDDLAPGTRQRLLDAAGQDEAEAVADLWRVSLDVLGIGEWAPFHPEDLLDLSAEHARMLLAGLAPAEDEVREALTLGRVRAAADRLLETLLDEIGPRTTLRGFLLRVTGADILEEMRPILLRHLSSFLDQGLAAWHNPDRAEGFWVAWRRSALADPGWLLDDIPDWQDSIASLPDDPQAALDAALWRIGLPADRHESYLERLALELPGWSGMVLWRHLRPGYQDLEPRRVEMIDWLAVRATLEGLYARRLCRAQWQIEARLDIFRWRFRHNRGELLVREALFAGQLPEYLEARAQRLLRQSPDSPTEDVGWDTLANMLWTWRLARQGAGRTAPRDAWPLFRLAQHLGLCARQLREGGSALAEALLACLARLDDETTGHLWLQAYERHYQAWIFDALAGNRGRGRWSRRDQSPAGQVIFCMDDREEGIRRHLEELDPAIETLGAAGFFGVPMNWLGLDDTLASPLCPVVVTPSNAVREVPAEGAGPLHQAHQRKRAGRLAFDRLLARESHRGVVVPALVALAAAPAALLALSAKAAAPLRFGRLVEAIRSRIDGAPPTRVTVNAPEDGRQATPDAPREGFTDAEQAGRVEGFLRTVGLTYGFSPLVVMMGHGSMSQNNPHLAAYDCGACSGRHGGPNARVFAAMANRLEVRAALRRRGIDIPETTWFLGAEHNTGDEDIVWYDLDVLPPSFTREFERMRRTLDAAREHSAHERARRFASAPRLLSPAEALAHVAARGRDFSQARPELGHATNAAALIGRRSMSRGAFFDRRVFLISYDPTQDREGLIAEAILLAAGPVGAGISLEYYFSTVNNERYGCGSKVTHNIAGFLGVMEGTASDLRTGLPRQMIEIHEAMRLLVVVEQTTEVLTRIYQRQPVLQELVGGAWIHLAAQDPDTGALALFRPGLGWRPWREDVAPLPVVARSADWYAGHLGPLPPALVEVRP